jgi:hypothetical protein
MELNETPVMTLVPPDITEDVLARLGFREFRWNGDHGFSEWYVPISGNGLGPLDSRLSVTFGGFHRGRMVWVAGLMARRGFPYCAHIDLYYMLTGRSFMEAWAGQPENEQEESDAAYQ